MIDKEKAMKTFLAYAAGYDLEDSKIRLKAEHTEHVAALSEEIACSLGLPEEEMLLAFLIGVLHDIGRFEQVRKYGTFLDAQSVNHAHLSADLLFKEGLIRDFEADEKDYALIETAVRQHNVYRLPETLTEREQMFCRILRDADKIDIIRVNRETPMTQIYDLPEEAFLNSPISDPVFEDMMAHRDVNRANSRTGADYLMGHIAFVFGMVYPVSLKLVKEQGYLDEMLAFQSNNDETRKRMEMIREEIYRYLDEGIRLWKETTK